MVLLITLCTSLGQQKLEWTGKIEHEEDVKVIKNPKEPLYGEIKFELMEDLSIGKEDDENYIFFRGLDFVVNNSAEILILDYGNCRIQVFSSKGEYTKTIGRQGQGPGEFENPTDIHLDSDDNIYVQDGRKLHFFSRQGEFNRTIQLENPFGTFPQNPSLDSFGIMSKNNILGYTYSLEPETGTMDIISINVESGLLINIASFPSQRVSVVNNRRLFLFNPYYSYLYFCMLNEDTAVFGVSDEYKIFVINSSGETLFVIEKDEPQKSISGKEKNKIISEKIENVRNLNIGIDLSKGETEKILNFKGHRPFYDGILTDDSGSIYVSKFKSVLEEQKNVMFDLFNSEGYFLYKVDMQISPYIIKGGYVYSSDIDGEILAVKRYKIKNWDQIKTGIN